LGDDLAAGAASAACCGAAATTRRYGMHPNRHRQASRVTVLLLVLGVAALSAAGLPAAHAASGTTVRVSVATDGS
jgi:hypothetical protein